MEARISSMYVPCCRCAQMTGILRIEKKTIIKIISETIFGFEITNKPSVLSLADASKM